MNKNIFLVGFSSAGKSTIGPILARRIDNTFIDLDFEIASFYKKSVIELFNEQGEHKFRILEQEMLRSVVDLPKAKVISTGGGTPLTNENRSIIIQNGVTVYLKVSKQTLLKRLMDSNNTNSAAQFLASIFCEKTSRGFLEKLIDFRSPFYVTIADCTIDIENVSPDEIATNILSQLKRGNFI